MRNSGRCSSGSASCCLLGRVHRPDIAQDVRQGRALRIVAQQPGIEDHARQLGRMRRRSGRPRPSPDPRGPGAARTRGAAAPRPDGVDPLCRQAHQGGQALEHAAQIAGLLADDQHAVGRDIAGQRPAGTVEDLAARRDQQPLVGAVVLGQQREVGAALDLEVVQPCRQRAEERELRAAQDQGAASEAAGALSLRLLHGSPPWPGVAPARAGRQLPDMRGTKGRPRA